MSFGQNFLPGPTDVHPDVLGAMTGPMFGHRSERMRALIARAQPRLQQLFGTGQPVFIVTSSGTGLMEAAVRNAVTHRLLAVVSGYFGEMFARIGEACGKEVIRVIVRPGESLDPDHLKTLLDGPQVDAVSMVHSESSTGSLAPVAELARVVHQHSDALVLVDGITSVGGLPVDMDRAGLDMVFTGSQKALALPPGLAFGAVSERFVERLDAIEDAGFYLNIRKAVNFAIEGLPYWTPAVSLYLALERQVERIDVEGGAPARWARHAVMASTIAAWVEAHPQVQFLAQAGRRSPTVSALLLPPESRPGEIAAQLEAQGFLIGLSLDPKYGNLIRLGHMGDLEPGHLATLLTALEPLI